MRIMDGTSKRRDKNQGDPSHYTAGNMDLDLVNGHADESKATKRRRQLDMKAREDELRKYEETVFVNYVVESNNMRNKKQFAKDFDDNVRKKYSGKVCPYYNGGEKRIFETELNVNPYFERMAKRVLTKIGKIH